MAIESGLNPTTSYLYQTGSRLVTLDTDKPSNGLFLPSVGLRNPSSNYAVQITKDELDVERLFLSASDICQFITRKASPEMGRIKVCLGEVLHYISSTMIVVHCAGILPTLSRSGEKLTD